MISQTVEYALRAAVVLAQQSPQPATARQIAERTQVPLAYLSKILLLLTRAGLIRSQRGLHGGFALAGAPREISLLAVVNAVEPVLRIRACPLGIQSHRAGLCPLHRRLDAVAAGVERAFATTTLADLLNEPGATPLCERSSSPLARVSGRPSAPARGIAGRAKPVGKNYK